MTLEQFSTSRPHPFDRSGLATLSDLQATEWEVIFRLLEKEQSEFLAKEYEFRSPEYKWSRDPLHTWSRLWEYPYVYHHLRAILRGRVSATIPLMVDYGSGVTFFPFSAARLGYHVTCTDIDPICAHDITRAARVVPHSPGMVDFALIKGDSLPFNNDAVDVVVCISVLEHIPTFEASISEMARILKPGGVLILTIDLDLRGDSEIGVARHRTLVSELRRYFEFSHPESTIHPADVLNTSNSPFSPATPRGLRCSWFQFKQVLIKQVLKPLFGRKRGYWLPFFLSVQGFMMHKRHARK